MVEKSRPLGRFIAIAGTATLLLVAVACLSGTWSGSTSGRAATEGQTGLLQSLHSGNGGAHLSQKALEKVMARQLQVLAPFPVRRRIPNTSCSLPPSWSVMMQNTGRDAISIFTPLTPHFAPLSLGFAQPPSPGRALSQGSFAAQDSALSSALGAQQDSATTGLDARQLQRALAASSPSSTKSRAALRMQTRYSKGLQRNTADPLQALLLTRAYAVALPTGGSRADVADALSEDGLPASSNPSFEARLATGGYKSAGKGDPLSDLLLTSAASVAPRRSFSL